MVTRRRFRRSSGYGRTGRNWAAKIGYADRPLGVPLFGAGIRLSEAPQSLRTHGPRPSIKMTAVPQEWPTDCSRPCFRGPWTGASL